MNQLIVATVFINMSIITSSNALWVSSKWIDDTFNADIERNEFNIAYKYVIPNSTSK